MRLSAELDQVSVPLPRAVPGPPSLPAMCLNPHWRSLAINLCNVGGGSVIPKSLRARVRQAITTAARGVCVYCRTEIGAEPSGESGPTATIDHVVPGRRFWRNRISNLVPACEACNLSKGALTPRDFFRARPVAAVNFLAIALWAHPDVRAQAGDVLSEIDRSASEAA